MSDEGEVVGDNAMVTVEMSPIRAAVKVQCKYCLVRDLRKNMHRDIFTKEYYHDACRPSVRRGYEEILTPPIKLRGEGWKGY